jgi:hypothetical protein
MADEMPLALFLYAKEASGVASNGRFFTYDKFQIGSPFRGQSEASGLCLSIFSISLS